MTNTYGWTYAHNAIDRLKNESRNIERKVDINAGHTPEPLSTPTMPTVKPAKESVNHPSHYNVGTIEVIDAIESWKLNFSRGSAVKYIARAGHKDDELEDLRKAAWYINREIERLERLRE